MRVMAAVRARVEVAARAAHGSICLLEDGLALVVGEIRGREAGTRVELHLAVAAVVAQVEEDGQAVVEAGPPDAPLVDERDGVLLGARRVVGGLRLHLRVDDDLGAGALLDGRDGLPPSCVDDRRG